jgi:Ca2+-binding RTX toxin-like protein
VLDGGTGIDTADYSASPAGVSINLATGIGHGGDAEGDTLISIEHVIGSAFDDTFQGGTDRGQFIGGDGNDTGNDYLTAANGNYTLVGGAGNDTLEFAGAGHATFTGGDGADVFTYRVSLGTTTVTDFEQGVDHIFLWDNHYNGNVPFESLTITDSAEGAVISWNGMSQMTLNGIHASQITHNDFVV